MASPAIAVGVAEWLLFKRQIRRLEVGLGVFAGLMGSMALFALITNVAEAILHGWSPTLFWLGLACICLAIAAYCFWCCWLRVRGQTIVELRGFPVSYARTECPHPIPLSDIPGEGVGYRPSQRD